MRRRTFLKNSGLPLLAPIVPAFSAVAAFNAPPAGEPAINFIFDGEFYDPATYISKLQSIHAAQPIAADSYGNGGTVAALEKKFEDITGKEKAMFMPTGTLANQLAIRVLSGDNTKVFVQETSHVFRDEADAAQSVHNKRLVPLAKGETGFTLEELQQAVDYHLQGEVFPSGIGVVSIENPVRRTDGRMIPIEELRRISAWCRQKGYKLHLDGARLHMAATWAGLSIADYAALFDTVYISLYKYLGAASGAILCGDKAVMDKMTHLMKIYGATMFRNWTNAALPLRQLEGLDQRLQQSRKKGDELVALMNRMPDMKIAPISNGTNIYMLQFAQGFPIQPFVLALAKDHNIRIGRPDAKGLMRFSINETILYRDLEAIHQAFKSAAASAKK